MEKQSFEVILIFFIKRDILQLFVVLPKSEKNKFSFCLVLPTFVLSAFFYCQWWILASYSRNVVWGRTGGWILWLTIWCHGVLLLSRGPMKICLLEKLCPWLTLLVYYFTAYFEYFLLHFRDASIIFSFNIVASGVLGMDHCARYCTNAEQKAPTL